MKYILAVLFTIFVSASCLKKPFVPSPTNTADREFANEIISCNRFIKDAASLALTKATDTQVRLFAGELAYTHNNAHDDLQDLAELLEIPISGEADSGQLQTEYQLSKAEGQAFDSLFVYTQIIYHNTAISMLNNEIHNGSQPDLINYAKGLLPQLTLHQQKGEILANKY